MREILATQLQEGMVLALPFGRVATVTQTKVGRQFVNFTTKEYGKSRVGKTEHMIIEEEDQ